MKKMFLVICIIFVFCDSAFADYKPIPKNLSQQYKKEITRIINTQYPVAIRKTKQIRRNSHKMYLKVLKNKDFYMDYVTNNFDMIISVGEFNLLTKIIDITDRYVKIKDDDALATDYNGAILDFLDPYFKDNGIKTDKLDNLSNLIYINYNEITAEQKSLSELFNDGSGLLQQQYEKEKSSKYKDFKRFTASYIVQQDLKNYRCCRKSFYGEVMYLIDNADEKNHRFLLQIKKNFDNCSKDLKCWEYIGIDDYDYSWLDNATKNTIWFNNMVFEHK